MLNVDGWGDEVYLQWSAAAVRADETFHQWSERTPVMGDVTNRPERLRAGRGVKSSKGGILSGDEVFDRKFVIFQGDIPAGGGIAITPLIWEWDGGEDLVTVWGQALVDHGEQVAKAVVQVVKVAHGGIPGIPNAADFIVEAVGAGLPDLYKLQQATIGKAGDRPIGYGQPKYPLTLVITEATASTIARSSFGREPGIYPLQFKDVANGQGDYTLYLEIQTREFTSGTMVKDDTDPRVYVIVGGAKFWLPDPNWVDRFGGWAQVLNVAPGVLQGVPGTPVDGTVVREWSSAPVYVIQQRERRWIPTPQVLRDLGYSWADVQLVPDGSLAAIPQGPDAAAAGPDPVQLDHKVVRKAARV